MGTMIKTFTEGVLTVTKKDTSILILKVHPERQDTWRSEKEALAFPITKNYPFLLPEVKKTAPISIPAFKALFTLTERIAISDSTDVGVKLLWADIEDARTTEIHLDLPFVIEGVNHLETIGCIVAGRAAVILGN
jgi:hypothetical protein